MEAGSGTPGSGLTGCLEADELIAFACGELPEARIAAAEAHVDRCAACGQALAEAITHSSPPRGKPTFPAALRFVPGDELAGGRYRIVRFIARGGMGEVYEAEDLVLGERIALKSLVDRPGDGSRGIEHLKAEAQLARRVTHPNVCRIFDIGLHEGHLFLTMELLTGETLGARIRREGPIPPHQVKALVVQMCAALEAAHRAGVIHRDFKSDNVMLLEAPDGAGASKLSVMDFGLARHSRSLGGGTLSTLTGPGPVLGSVGYMAPEQVAGQPTTAASDVYALGVVLFEMFTGRLPFIGPTPLATAVLRMTDDPPPLRQLVPNLDRRWEQVVSRCLARDPQRRFTSVGALMGALPGAQQADRRLGRSRRLQMLGLFVTFIVAGVVMAAVKLLERRYFDRPIGTPPAAPAALARPKPSPVPPPPAPAAIPAAATPSPNVLPKPPPGVPARTAKRRKRVVRHEDDVLYPSVLDSRTGP